MGFCNLKIHTDYSFLEGVSKIEEYIQTAKRLNQNSIGITDTNLHAMYKFYNQCIKNDIKPILGLEVYIKGFVSDDVYAISIYAKNDLGYRSLIRLSNISRQKKYKNKNIVDIEDILKEKENIIIILGGINSEIYDVVVKKDFYKIDDLINKYIQNFNDFYFELICFDDNREYEKIIKKYNLKCVATNDTYYDEQFKHELQEVVSIIKGTKPYTNKNLYMKSLNEILDDLSGIDLDILNEAIENTEKISDICNVNIKSNQNLLPKIDANLKDIVYENISRKYPNLTEQIKNRIDYELNIIDQMGFNSYFLIVKDIVDYAKNNDILIGPGRGSASGSIISYILGITNVDPIKYNLIFERFLNPYRVGLPDIDLDIEAYKKDKLIQYVINKYGIENVCNIVTFTKYTEKLVENDLRSFKKKPSKKIAKYLIGNVKNSSIHASGVVISSQKLENIIGYYYEKTQNINISQFDMEDLEKIGLLKMDFLSLVNLDLLNDMVKRTNIRLEDIPLDDKKTFEIYNMGYTIGIFQSESIGMTKLLKSMKINSILDISLALALYRPGPLAQGFVNDIILYKKKNKNLEHKLKILDEILSDTYGYIIYQEQVMEIFKRISNFDMGISDNLRRAISKKKPEIIEKLKSQFIQEGIQNGYDESDLIDLYEKVKSFSEYAFNKSHSVAYALVSYYTAYFKANYNQQYILSCLDHGIISYDKLMSLILECTKILPCDINKSDYDFKIEDDGSIRYGLSNIKGIDREFVSKLIEDRNKKGDFTDINNFARRIYLLNGNKSIITALSNCGALDIFGISRREIDMQVSDILYVGYKNENIKELLFNTSNNSKETVYESKNYHEYKIDEKISKEIEYTFIPFSYENLYDININNFNLVNIQLGFDRETCQYYFYRKIKGKTKAVIYLNQLEKIQSQIYFNIDNIENLDKLKEILNEFKGGNCKCKFFGKNIDKKNIYIKLNSKLIKALNNSIKPNNFVITLNL